MTYAPASLKDLMAYLGTKGVRNLGIVGDAAHVAAGRSYHLGQDQLKPWDPVTRQPYSIATARDKAGLSNAASAADLGKVNGTLIGLQRLSNWLVRECVGRAPDTLDVREIIWSRDGVSVTRWDREGIPPTTGSSSHLTHTHISWYRDSEARDKTAVFRRYFEEAEVLTTITITVLPFGGGYVIPANKSVTAVQFDPKTGGVAATKVWDAVPEPASANYDATVYNTAVTGDPFLRCTNGHFAPDANGSWFLSAGQVTETPNGPPAPDCSAEYLAGRQDEWDRIAIPVQQAIPARP